MPCAYLLMTNNQNPATEQKGTGIKDVNYIKVLSIAQPDWNDWGSLIGYEPAYYQVVSGKTRFDLIKNLKNCFECGSKEALSYVKEIEERNPDIWGNWVCYLDGCEVKLLEGVVIEGKIYVNVKVT